MKSKIIFIIISLFLVCGCTMTKTSLQEINIEQALMNIPVKITENNSAGKVTLGLSISGYKNNSVDANISGHTLVNDKGIYQLEKVSDGEYREYAGVNTYFFKGKNFLWKLPEYSIIGNFDFCVNNNFAFFGGISYNLINDKENWNSNFGFGFFNEYDKMAFRVDMGIINNRCNYSIEYVKVEDKVITGNMYREVRLFNRSFSESYWGTFFSTTINTRNITPYVNFFVNYCIGIQTLYDIDLPEDMNTDKNNFSLNSTVHNISCGLFQHIYGPIRVILGIKFHKFKVENTHFNKTSYFSQIDFIL